MRAILAASIALCLALSVSAAEPAAASYPLWDGHETVAEYAQRVNLPATAALELGGGVKMELVLIPAGKFLMGTPEPVPVDEEGYGKQIVVGQAVLAASGVALLVMLSVVAIRAVRKKRWPQVSLGRLLLVTVAAGGCVLSGLHWRHSVQSLEKANAEYAAAKARYDSALQSEKPAHAVTLTQPFYMGKFVVTQEQYEEMTGMNLSSFKGKDNPVEQVSWEDSQVFCKRLTGEAKQAVRLPTEAEWEFACRAGTTTTYHSGDTEADLGRVAWHSANSKGTTHPVGRKEPNAFGLYDMHGNVAQWCQDWYGEDYYRKAEAENPQGPAQGARRVLRGGSWGASPRYCRSASRYRRIEFGGSDIVGFRVVVVVVASASRMP